MPGLLVIVLQTSRGACRVSGSPPAAPSPHENSPTVKRLSLLCSSYSSSFSPLSSFCFGQSSGYAIAPGIEPSHIHIWYYGLEVSILLFINRPSWPCLRNGVYCLVRYSGYQRLILFLPMLHEIRMPVTHHLFQNNLTASLVHLETCSGLCFPRGEGQLLLISRLVSDQLIDQLTSYWQVSSREWCMIVEA